MWLTKSGYGSECGQVHDALEGISRRSAIRRRPCAGCPAGTIARRSARTVKDVTTAVRFAANCWKCAECCNVRTLAATRALFPGSRDGGDLRSRRGTGRISQTWAAVPRLAYRLSVLASLSLLVAAGWLYQQPRHASVTSASAAQNYRRTCRLAAATLCRMIFLLNPVGR